MEKIPTDLEILEEIYYRYYDDFRKYANEDPERIARIRVPVDVREIAKACGLEEDMVFGRMFYHFNKKYSYKDEKGEITTFFITDKFQGLSINFPLVASVMADLKTEKKLTETFIIISAASLVISLFALAISLIF